MQTTPRAMKSRLSSCIYLLPPFGVIKVFKLSIPFFMSRVEMKGKQCARFQIALKNAIAISKGGARMRVGVARMDGQRG